MATEVGRNMNTAAATCIPGSVSTQKYSDEQNGRSSQAVVRLLIVEDDPDISSLLVCTLERAHFHATAVGDCKTAWEVMADNAFDLILLDWMLPDMSGIELLQRMRQHAAFSEIPLFRSRINTHSRDIFCLERDRGLVVSDRLERVYTGEHVDVSYSLA